MEAPLISVIVPVYNVEAYLDRCVQSIADQTYRNLEIILVDDGSPDNCGAMCDAWAEKDSRIRVIHKENGGLSDARNAGMAAASGEYLGFVDSDDYIAPEMYQLLYTHICENACDISACGVELVYEDGTEPRMLTGPGSRVLNRSGAMEAMIRESWLKQPVWYKLYRADRVRDLLFPVGKYHEDVFWSWQAVAAADRVAVFDTPCYFYVQRSGSIMGEGYSLKRLDAVEAKLQRQTWLEERFPELAEEGRINLLFTCLYHGQMALKHLHGEEKRKAMTVLKAVVSDFSALCGTQKNPLSLTRRCWLAMAAVSFPLTCRLRNLLGIGM